MRWIFLIFFSFSGKRTEKRGKRKKKRDKFSLFLTRRIVVPT